MLVGFSQQTNRMSAPHADPPGLTKVKNVDKAGLVRLYRLQKGASMPDIRSAEHPARTAAGVHRSLFAQALCTSC